MVESAGREATYEALLAEARASFAKAEEIPVIKEIEKDQITVRQTAENQYITCVAEAKRIEGLTPQQFQVFFERWAEASVTVNPDVESVTQISEDGGYKNFCMHVKFPWPFWARKEYVTLYVKSDKEKEEEICIFSSKDNEKIEEEFFNDEEKKNFVLMKQMIGAWILTPIKDESGAVVATNMKFANASDTGGIIPTAVTDKFVPAAVASMTAGTIEWVRSQQK